MHVEESDGDGRTFASVWIMREDGLSFFAYKDQFGEVSFTTSDELQYHPSAMEADFAMLNLGPVFTPTPAPEDREIKTWSVLLAKPDGSLLGIYVTAHTRDDAIFASAFESGAHHPLTVIDVHEEI